MKMNEKNRNKRVSSPVTVFMQLNYLNKMDGYTFRRFNSGSPLLPSFLTESNLKEKNNLLSLQQNLFSRSKSLLDGHRRSASNVFSIIKMAGSILVYCCILRTCVIFGHYLTIWSSDLNKSNFSNKQSSIKLLTIGAQPDWTARSE